MKFYFGRYKDTDISDVPTTYLKWAEENIKSLTPDFREAINIEIENREGNISGKGRVVRTKQGKEL